MADDTSLDKAARILSRDDFESLEQQVAAHREALKAMHQAMREMARETQRRLDRLDPPGRMARY